MRRLSQICLLALVLVAATASAEGVRDEVVEELSPRLDAPAADDRLAAVEGLFAWALTAEEPETAMRLLERASGDRSKEVSAQAEHLLRLLMARRPDHAEAPPSDHEPAATRGRRDAAQLRDLQAWRDRLANGDPSSRLQAVKALAAHARVATHRAEVLKLLELSTADRDLAVATQARTALAQLAQTGVRADPPN